jgi:hypothetical protein
MAGDRLKARAAYQDFLTLSRDADPGIPLPEEAKTEYAKLQYAQVFSREEVHRGDFEVLEKSRSPPSLTREHSRCIYI